MRFIDRTKVESVTDEDMYKEIRTWKSNKVGTLSEYLGIPNELRLQYDVGALSFEDMLTQAIALDQIRYNCNNQAPYYQVLKIILTLRR